MKGAAFRYGALLGVICCAASLAAAEDVSGRDLSELYQQWILTAAEP